MTLIGQDANGRAPRCARHQERFRIAAVFSVTPWRTSYDSISGQLPITDIESTVTKQRPCFRRCEESLDSNE
jgi:hypothetical protein